MKHILGCVAFLLVLVSVTTNGQEIQLNRYYYIQSQVSGLYLDVYMANKEVGGKICQAVKNSEQVWRFEPSEKYPGYYHIQSKVSGLYLDVYMGNSDVGGRICQAVKHPEQVWRFEPSEKYPGYYHIQSKVVHRHLLCKYDLPLCPRL